MSKEIQDRLEYLRGEIDAERISYGEIAELQSLAQYIAPDDVQLREWAGIPEFGGIPESDKSTAHRALSELRNLAMEHTRQPNDAWSTAYHIAQDALDILDPTKIESVTGIEPRCDICGLAQQPEDEWNGETGNHVACEEYAAREKAQEQAVGAEDDYRSRLDPLNVGETLTDEFGNEYYGGVNEQ